MYFVDREKIEETLKYMEKMLDLIKAKREWKTEVEKIALERIAETIIESIIDVGNAMIDGFIMRDPGSYEDIIDILEDEKVIENEVAQQLRAVIAYRKPLVRQYTSIDQGEIYQLLIENLDSLESFPICVRKYLINELGPVTAFKK
ncbi:hypothetical protein NG54_12230 [Heyndrickxia ginsengihumi]|uniref:DUF86 domain-containing protein n=1 Tax=Heyndrickxia ginsengihumi TaxID=363870 RepID=A0A0A6V9T1_9BACI|nr:DUF86 domain-containing protein [Heyndrickxia ginsengihumi]KHD84970.1 hypothetical protein NG54_12230 [Heyndrickxia ginsengihumi]